LEHTTSTPQETFSVKFDVLEGMFHILNLSHLG
jgi:hypothetical protein